MGHDFIEPVVKKFALSLVQSEIRNTDDAGIKASLIDLHKSLQQENQSFAEVITRWSKTNAWINVDSLSLGFFTSQSAKTNKQFIVGLVKMFEPDDLSSKLKL